MHILVEIQANILRRLGQSLDGTDERRLVVQSFARVGNKYGWDTQRIVNNESRRRRVPRRIAASLERVAQATVGETGGIRFLLHQELAAKFFNHTAVAIVLDEGIVLFGGAVGQGLEPVRVMRYTLFQRPHPHTRSHEVGYFAVDRRAAVDGLGKGLVGLLGEILLHRLPVKNIFTEIFRYFLMGGCSLYSFSVGSFFYCIEARN